MNEYDPTRGDDWVDRRKALKTIAGFVIALLLVVLLALGIGWEQTIERLRTTSLEWVLIACLSTLLCLVTWTKIWQIILGTIDVTVSYRQLLVTYYAGTFANYVTPMGQAGGEPFIAYILSRDTDATYEESLAIVITADLIRFLPFVTIGGVGLVYLLRTPSLGDSIELLASYLLLLALALPLSMAAAWRFRDSLQEAILQVVAPIVARTSRLSRESIRERIDRLYTSLELIADSPRSLLAAIVVAYAGWILFALPLYFSGLALGAPVSLLLVCFVVPASVVAGSAPLPGGLAAIEVTIVALLTALTALTTPDALAVTAIYRLTSYWIVIAIGGLAALWVVRRA